jgi:hypothetical protein
MHAGSPSRNPGSLVTERREHRRRGHGRRNLGGCVERRQHARADVRASGGCPRLYRLGHSSELKSVAAAPRPAVPSITFFPEMLLAASVFGRLPSGSIGRR